jgi:hypothetical protein
MRAMERAGLSRRTVSLARTVCQWPVLDRPGAAGPSVEAEAIGRILGIEPPPWAARA